MTFQGSSSTSNNVNHVMNTQQQQYPQQSSQQQPQHQQQQQQQQSSWLQHSENAWCLPNSNTSMQPNHYHRLQLHQQLQLQQQQQQYPASAPAPLQHLHAMSPGNGFHGSPLSPPPPLLSQLSPASPVPTYSSSVTLAMPATAAVSNMSSMTPDTIQQQQQPWCTQSAAAAAAVAATYSHQMATVAPMVSPPPSAGPVPCSQMTANPVAHHVDQCNQNSRGLLINAQPMYAHHAHNPNTPACFVSQQLSNQALYYNSNHHHHQMAIATSAPQNGISIQSEQPAAVHTHLALWALAESHFRKAHNVLLRQKSTELSTDTDGGWRQSLLAGLSCLHGVLRLCEAPRAQDRRVSRDMLVLGPEIEAKTRLRIAQVLGEWCEGPECAEQEEALLTRALMVVPASESCLDTRYSIVATQCQLFLRRGEYKWAEQKIKAALSDAQQRLVHRWVHFFALELSHLYSTSGDPLGAMGALRTAVAYAQNTGDKAAEAVVGVQLLGKMVEERLWTDASSIADKLKGLVSDPALGTLPNVKSRFWILQGASAAMLGNHAAAQEACASARYALKEWQTRFAKMMAANRVADAGSSFFIHNIPGSNGLRIQGCTYYEAHAWVMLVSAYSAHGDDAQDQSAGFLRLALEGINRGEADGFKSQLVSVKLLVLLNIVDRAIGSLQLSEAKQALDQTLSVVLENESAARTKGAGSKPRSSALWRQSRDAIALRWAMYKHRTGDLEAAADGYRCVAANGTGDLRFAARVNEIMTRLLRVHDESESAQIRKDVEMLAKETSPLPQSSAEKVRLSVVEFLQGLECTEPVKAKTCLLACLRSCTEVANTALQGWTLCLLGTLVLSTGQYTQAMKMCGAAQAMAQKANDPLQNAAAIGILVNIENAVGDPERCAQLLKVDQQFLEQFNARIAEHA